MKKIMGVVGSPRKNGNTHILVSTILQGAQESGNETDIILLGDHKIKECTGCHACWKGRICPRHDDMNDLYSRIIECDALILGTPVYWFGPTALMKAFIDRFVYFNCPENRAKITGKPVLLAIPLEDENPDTYTPVVEFFRKSIDYLHMNLADMIIAPGVGRKGEIREQAEKMKEAGEMGRRIGLDLLK
ncbi:MAG: flavodoxin family protein [Candidatus Latescibacterota bacterium]